MAYASWDSSIMPPIENPFNNSQEVTKRYLGGKAITGQEYAEINCFILDNAQAKALYQFWRDDCNHGLDPFWIGLPINGSEASLDVPTALCQFVEDISIEKIELHWKQNIKLKVLEYGEILGTSVDDAGNIMVDDSGKILVSTSAPISNSNKEITYG